MLVCGPPCAGKTTYVERRAKPGDLVLDLDAFAIDAGSDHPHNHRRIFRAQAERRMVAEMSELFHRDPVRAWVIRTLPRGDERDQVARHIGATQIVVLNPGARELHRRAKARSGWTHPAIDVWLQEFTPGDERAGDRTSRSW